MKKTFAFLLIFSLILASFAVIGVADQSKGKITVGTKDFTEQWIVGWMVKLLLEDDGFNVELKKNLPSPTLRAGVESGDIDIMMSYDGTAYTTYLDRAYKGEGRVPWYAFPWALKVLDKPNGLTWITEKGLYVNNTWALCVKEEWADEHDVHSISDLADYINNEGQVDWAVGNEFYERPDGLPALQETYGFEVNKSSLQLMSIGLTMRQVDKDQATVGMIYGTDPHAKELGLKILKDNKGFWPPYNLFPVVRTEILEEYPEIKDLLIDLAGAFPQPETLGGSAEYPSAQQVMMEMNHEADLSDPPKDPNVVAEEFLVENDLIEG